MSKLNLEINNLTPEKIDKRFLKEFAEKVLKLIKIKIPEISLVLVCDARIKNLNKKYRKRNRVTDVLAFDYGLPFGGQARLDSARQGEIIICLPQAKRQAKQMRHSLKDELGTLLIHGILHLAGYNDETKKDYNKMLNKQKEVWQKVTLS